MVKVLVDPEAATTLYESYWVLPSEESRYQ